MMIDPLASARSVGATRKSDKAKRQGDAFGRSLVETGSEPTVATAVEHANAVSAIDMLLSIQELSTDPEGRGQAKARGEQLLILLDEVRHGLLDGRIPIERIEALATLVKTARSTPGDAKLAETLEEIELLARVEAAKLGYDV
jgi:hypothetical protein